MSTTTTTLNDLLPSIIQEAQFHANENSLMRNLVKRFDLGPAQGKTVTVPVYNPMTANNVAESADISLADVSTDPFTATISEVGLGTLVKDLAVTTSSSNVIADIGYLFGIAIAEKMDADLLALLSSMSVTLGDGTTAITPAKIFEAVAKIRASKYRGQLYGVLRPEVAYDLKAALTNSFTDPNAGMLQNEAMVSGYIGSLAGVPFFESALITQTAGDSVGGIFAPDSLSLTIHQDIKLETQRSPKARGTEIVGTAVYGVGTMFTTHGAALNFDSSIAA
jgi:N4-gp56 family major capsid protein